MACHGGMAWVTTRPTEVLVKVLVLNAGSSTLKFSLFEVDGEQVLLEGLADWAARPARLIVRSPGRPERKAELHLEQHADAVSQVLGAVAEWDLAEIVAVGHRVVHGGSVYTAGTRITPEVKQVLGQLTELAPLHNPPSLETIAAAETALPTVPHVAVFDTGFHATVPPAAHTYPVPYRWTTEWGIRRYGFHGLSHAYCADRAAQMLKRPPAELRLVICHLGNGCSVSAVRQGVCVDTTMGFTPLEGLMMGTRSGSVDPGVLLHVLRKHGLTVDQLDQALNHESGLLGVSGVAADMRQVQAAAAGGNARAQLALDIYAYRVRQTIGAMTASLGGIEGLVFTAGVGENAVPMRAACCQGLGCLGLDLDPAANASCRPDADIATAQSPGRILVIHTREDLVIVRETLRVVRLGR